MKKEFWKEIVGYGGDYLISNYGNVKSYKYKKTRILKSAGSKNHYLSVVLMKNGIKSTQNIHFLVAKHFVNGYKKGLTVNHKDGNKRNNYFKNLEWCTYSQNINHAIKNGLGNKAFGERSGKNKLTLKNVIEIRNKYIPDRKTSKYLAHKFGVSVQTIYLVALKKSWKNS